MSCNTCGKSFTLYRKEKGCPACGYSFCSKCLNFKVFVDKLKAEASVCAKCKNAKLKGPIIVEPPDAYYKLKNDASSSLSTTHSNNPLDLQIADRLNKLKKGPSNMSEDSILKRLQNLKGDLPSTSDAALHERLANLRGVPVSIMQKTALPAPEQRSEQEQVDDLLLKFKEQSQIDSNYEEKFGQIVNNIESRLSNLKGAKSEPVHIKEAKVSTEQESSDDEDAVSKLLEKIKKETILEDDSFPPESNELPFCEICNEDAMMRCLGCKYLFCKRCFHEHKDDDDGCDRYELYTPKKLNQ